MITAVVRICPGSATELELASGLASLLQLRVTELPSSFSPEGLAVTEVVFGASVDNYISTIIKHV